MFILFCSVFICRFLAYLIYLSFNLIIIINKSFVGYILIELYSYYNCAFLVNFSFFLQTFCFCGLFCYILLLSFLCWLLFCGNAILPYRFLFLQTQDTENIIIQNISVTYHLWSGLNIYICCFTLCCSRSPTISLSAFLLIFIVPSSLYLALIVVVFLYLYMCRIGSWKGHYLFIVLCGYSERDVLMCLIWI